MATLKIAAANGSLYFADVRTIQTVHSFSFPGEHGDDSSQLMRGEDEVFTRAMKSLDESEKSLPRSCGFDTRAGFSVQDSVGHVIYLTRTDGAQVYVIAPADQCFLLSDAGKTIDRF